MAFENLFIRSKRTLGGIQLDAVISESHNNTVRVTTNPVEAGFEIADNAVNDPKQIAIEAVISDSPLGVAAFGQIIDLITGLFGTATARNLTRSNAAYNALVQLQEARQPITIQTRLTEYEDMVITSIQCTQNAQTSRITRLFITAQQLIITQSTLIGLSREQLFPGSPTEQGQSPENIGRKEPRPPSSATDRSTLKTLSDFIFG